MQAETTPDNYSIRSEIAMAITAALETTINAYLKLDPETLQQFARLKDKVIAIELEGMPDFTIKLYCLPSTQGISIMSQYQGKADTLISGRPLSLAKLTLFKDTRVMFDGEVKITGDVELGQKFKKILEGIDIDWEEHLSSVTGDVIAHKAGHAIQEISSWWRNNKARAETNGRDYLQQEVEVLPMSNEAEIFYNDIETLRDDTARIEARIKQLASKNKKKNKL